MTDNELVDQLHELKRRNQSPIALIEMFDALVVVFCGRDQSPLSSRLPPARNGDLACRW